MGPKHRIPIFAEALPRGDGTWILRPLPNEDAEWLTIQQTAKHLGWSSKRVYPHLGEYLVYKRPLPSRILVTFASADALKSATLDPEFWTTETRKESIRRAVRKAMALLYNRSLESAENRV